MTLVDVLGTLKSRARQLHLIDPQTGDVDEQELLGYVQGAVRFLASKYQLPFFLVPNREVVRTVANTDAYALPSDVQLWIPTATFRTGTVPRQPSGLALTRLDGTGVVALEYEDPGEWLVRALSTTTAGIPQVFTVSQQLLTLSPTPDAVYLIKAVQRSTQGDVAAIPDAAVAAVAVETLWRMAGDREVATPMLAEERRELTSALVNDQERLRWAAAKYRADRDWSRWQTSSR